MLKKIIKIFWFRYHSISKKITQYYYNRQMHHHFIHSSKIKGPIKFDIVVPLFNTKENYFCQMIDSVLNQSYQNWKLILVDASDHFDLSKLIMRKYDADPRITYLKLDNNLGIAGNTNAAFSKVTGDYCVLLDHDDFLELTALNEVYELIKTNKTIDLIYTDEDKYDDRAKKYFDPYYKSEPDLYKLRNNNYVCHMLVMSQSLLKIVSGENSQYDGAQDHDLILRCFENAKNIQHISSILYHWRVHEGSTSARPDSKTYAYEAGVKAISDHLERCHIYASVNQMSYPGYYEVIYQQQECPDILIHSVSDKNDFKSFQSIMKRQAGNVYFMYENGEIRDERNEEINNNSLLNAEFLCIINAKYLKLSNCCIEKLVGACSQEQVASVSGLVVGRFGVVKSFGPIKTHYDSEILPFGNNIVTQVVLLLNLNMCCIKTKRIKNINILIESINRKKWILNRKELNILSDLIMLCNPLCKGYFKY
ncbi:MAG: glycosyltransferase [Beduini sp.]|uniref:glycosyltransferase n=1 Tax=Beduini sp. TaxID=1922300 RepID=UPI0039A18C8A